jgi:predicted nucleotidyltransferase
MMGSVAYGVSNDTSDVDVYAFCIAPKSHTFPHLSGQIYGFGEAKNGFKRFTNLQQHHIQDKEADKVYDINVYNIVDYFQLVMECNPNMVDSLFTPQFCVLHSTRVGNIVREHRRKFLNLKAWHTFKGYAYSQIHKAESKEATGKRKELVDKYGYDIKFAYHVVRLLNEVEQILIEGDIDLQMCREQLKCIRRGEWTLQQIREYFTTKERELETLYVENKAKLPYGPQDSGFQDRVKTLLLHCLEEHYGSLDKCITDEEAPIKALREIDEILKRNRSLI